MRETPFDKALAVMEVVSSARRPLTVTEIAGVTGLPVPTAHRLVAQLVERSVLKRDLGSKRVMPGARLMRLGVAAIQASLHADKPHAMLRSLVTQVGEFAQISMVVEWELVCVDSASIHRQSGLHLEQGNRAPLHCTSIGKLYLASLSDAELWDWLKSARLERLTKHTVTTAAGLQRHCHEIRTRGWSSCNEEMHPGVVGCGVRLPLRTSSAFLGLCVSAPAARLSYKAITAYVPLLRKFAQDIANVVDQRVALPG